MNRRVFQLFLTVLGMVALVAGTLGVLVGADLVPGVERVDPSLDSEMRFFAAWYAIAGVVVLRSVPRVEEAKAIVRVVSAAVFVAGCGRILSWAMVGRPQGIFVVLMAIELALPFVLIPWQASVARETNRS
jgi:hypothetical protein